MRLGPPPRSSSWKGCTPTGASAATKNGVSPPKKNRCAASRGSASATARDKRAGASAPTSAAAITEAPMKWIKYSKYTGEDFGIDGSDLLQALADFLLQSGYPSEWNDHTLENLKEAIRQALESGQLFDKDALQEMMERLQNLSPEQMEELLDNLIQKMVSEGQRAIEEPGEAAAGSAGGAPDTKVKFQVSDKSLDFLGFKTLKDLLGSLGRSSFGRHDTRDLA